MASKQELQAAEAYAYPYEHIGHLKADHVKTLDKFKALCHEKGYFDPEEADKPASHDDETMLRYLRARKWNVQDAWAQFKSTEDWRKDNQIDKLYESIDVGEYESARRLYPQWTGRRDKRGIPLYVFEVGNLTAKAVATYESSSSKPGEVQSKLPPKLLRLFALYENLCNFALPLCSFMPERKYPETPVSQSSNIVDISNVSLKQFWNLKSHMQDASQLATAYYPETLDRIFVIGAPSFFPTVWAWTKRWFDPITVSKIFILSKSSTLPVLEEFVDRANIPKKYGGDLEFEFGDLPNVEPAIQNNLRWLEPHTEKDMKTFPVGPVKWRRSETTGNMTAYAVGTVNGKQRSVEVASIISLAKTPSAKQGEFERPITPPGPLARLSSAKETHPPTPPPGEADLSQPPSGSTTPTSSVRGTPVQKDLERSRLTSGSMPYRGGSPAPSERGPTSTPQPNTSSNPHTTHSVREGTSSSRYEQQASTHGDGQLETATPDVRKDAHGDAHGVMEPSTVSQAPKEHPLPEPAESGAQQEGPGNIVDQVKGVVGVVAATVVGVVGLDDGGKNDVVTAGAGQGQQQKRGDDDGGGGGGGGGGVGGGGEGEEGAAKELAEKGQARAVEEAPAEKIEEFLRVKSMSQQAQKVDGTV